MDKLYKSATSESAFRRLLAASVTPGGPEPPKEDGEEAGQGWGDNREAWPRQITRALERAVSSVREAAKKVDEIREVLSDVRLENATAARAEPRNVEEFRAKWLWFHRVSRKGEAWQEDNGASKKDSGHLLG